MSYTFTELEADASFAKGKLRRSISEGVFPTDLCARKRWLSSKFYRALLCHVENEPNGLEPRQIEEHGH